MFGFRLIADNQVGIVIKHMFGEKMRPGQIIATNGEIGVQAETLRPGLYWRMPFIWSIEKDAVVTIPPGHVGVLSAIDGEPLPSGRLLGDEVSCNTFQDAKAFLENHGYKGAQAGFLKPGVYRINTRLFKINATNAITVEKDKVGVAIAQDGIPLPSNRIIAPVPTTDCAHFQNPTAFIQGNGYRGPQLETLQPGEYYINPMMFEINTDSIATVPPGYVAVIISSVGEDLEKGRDAPHISTDPNLLGKPMEDGLIPLVTTKTERGILGDPIAPGSYNLNRLAYNVVLVPTSAITIDWATDVGGKETKYVGKEPDDGNDHSTEFFKFSQLRVTSKDGFQLEVDVRLIIRIPPQNAPAVIARFGNISNLIEQVAHPLIDSSFRNDAGNKAAMDFVHSRTALQEQALASARIEFQKYHVEVQGLLIAYIKVDEALLATQTKKEIAAQQQAQYVQEAAAQEQRITVMEQTARADKQKDVIAAKLAIDIETDMAESVRRKAAGTRDATKAEADGNSYAAQQVGLGQAAAYKAQTDVLGQQNVALLNVIQKIADGEIKITPDVLLTGGDGNNGSNLSSVLGALFATQLQDKVKENKDAAATAKDAKTKQQTIAAPSA
jgi:hypothetical protein